ncbi:MAG: tRNA epoxyqueuosine(34) reductase QueG [Thermoanaerobaculia bacterium]
MIPPGPDRMVAARVLREEAAREGFARTGFARAGEPPRFDRFAGWLDAGLHAGMRYLEETRLARSDPRRILPGARSVVCLSAEYPGEPYRSSDGAQVARYARGVDYHGTLRQRAERVARRAAERLGGPFGYRVCVDSTPLAERSFAAASGLGWIGKNGCLIDPDRGSYLWLAEIVTDLDLPPDDPIAEQCGSCVRCLQICPTRAFVAPGLLDANRCLAYWTIEHRGPLPDFVKEALDDRVFGCDLCQEVCPWNAPGRGEAEETADPPPTRAAWLAMGPGQWRRRYAQSALNRAGRRGLQRNAAASAGSVRDRALLPALKRASGVGEAGLADAAAWAAARVAPPG